VDGRPGLPGADINALGAWREATGDPDLVVAVLDAGISQSHPELARKLVPGWNCLNHTDQTDDHYTSHGTHVAGIIAAATGNRAGIAGIGWGTRLMPIVVVNKYGFGSESALAQGLIWAADHGARVASVSLGFNPPDGGGDDQVLRAAVQYATARGVLVCASTGNTPGAEIGAPARYPEVVAVGATDNRDELWSSTSTGPEMDLSAPGVSIWSTWDSVWRADGENTYAQKTGTSQACPHAAGVAALVLAANPNLSPGDVKGVLEATAKDLGPPGWDERYGAGRIDAAAAVRAAASNKGDLAAADARCIADFNGDGAVDSQDLVRYLNAFASDSRLADIAEPFGNVNIQDLLAFLNAHAQGCEP
jgi:subtilisin family serine protease